MLKVHPSPGSASPQNATLPFPRGKDSSPFKMQNLHKSFPSNYFLCLYSFFFFSDYYFFSFFPKLGILPQSEKVIPQCLGGKNRRIDAPATQTKRLVFFCVSKIILMHCYIFLLESDTSERELAIFTPASAQSEIKPRPTTVGREDEAPKPDEDVDSGRGESPIQPGVYHQHILWFINASQRCDLSGNFLISGNFDRNFLFSRNSALHLSGNFKALQEILTILNHIFASV